ncbi:hypothetical protein EK21DRAFT_101605 [Setomelanomma holmii]|uniref:Asl1-like glycosyl hydrolase catalytic domain-containing protein n=1 Tax=Setomelanomma holmii TaxID=210430 RepID=A0A9P4LLJ0_9PLEO|nr:hypothetical protein EK21DRAFT_101605 [Setomelanomma holmii]
MRRILLLPAALSLLTTISTQSTSPKRGLCHVHSSLHPSDDLIWISGRNNPTWYYNYGKEPSPAYVSTKDMQFVPMLWGASDKDTGTPFYNSIKSQLDNGANIKYVLSFNEPDTTHAVGGSDLTTSLAASRWKAEIEPLRALGIKVGAPGVTGAESGWNWLDNWLKSCDGGCNPDFMTVHWYGNFEGMMSHLGRVTAKWPDKEVWITEFGYPKHDLRMTQEFWNMSSRSLDSWPNITHYSYFGAFRSDVSNVGPNAAMLDQNGALTDIGSWFLGGSATNFVPKKSSGSLTRQLPRIFKYIGQLGRWLW